MECAGMRESTSPNQANGSTPHRLQEAIKLRNTAAVWPPLSLPKNDSKPHEDSYLAGHSVRAHHSSIGRNDRFGLQFGLQE
jgi:hypothetical protein